MKNKIYSLVSVLGILFISCEKDPETVYETITVTETVVVTETETITLTNKHINTMCPIYFYWIFIMGILVTPSQHRVHHAINKEYIDKNLAAIFCVWDRAIFTYSFSSFLF